MRIMHHQGVGPSRPGDTRKAITAIIITAVVTGLLVLAMHCHGAPPPPFPTVKRPAPLLSPKAASVPKSTLMVKASSFTPASELPRLPMTGGIAYTAEGEFYFVAAAWKPKNTGLIMAWSTKANGPYSFLAGWGPYPEDQWVSGIAWTAELTVFIRATPGSPTTDMSPASGKNATKFPGRFIKLPATKTKPRMPTTPQRESGRVER